MSKQQLQADIAESREDEEFEENLTEEEGKAMDEQWDKTLTSDESASFLDGLIAEGLKELNERK